MAFKGITAFVLNKANGGGGGGGTTNYNELTNQPQINGHTLTGNQTSEQLDIDTSISATYDPATETLILS